MCCVRELGRRCDMRGPSWLPGAPPTNRPSPRAPCLTRATRPPPPTHLLPPTHPLANVCELNPPPPHPPTHPPTQPLSAGSPAWCACGRTRAPRTPPRRSRWRRCTSARRWCSSSRGGRQARAKTRTTSDRGAAAGSGRGPGALVSGHGARARARLPPAYVREPVGQWGHTCSNCVETHAQIVMARALECDDGGGVGADSSLRTALRQPWCGALLLLLPPPRRQLPDLLAALRQPPPPLQGSQQSRP